MIKVSAKRILAFLPYAGAYFLALGLAALAIAFFGQNVLFKEGQFSAVKVGCYVPSDSELNSAGFNFISNMNSIEDTVSFVQYDSEEEVAEAVYSEDVSAGLIIPDNFAAGIFSGANPEIRLIFKTADTFDEHVLNDVMLVLANDLGVGQAATQTIYTLCDDYGVEYPESEDLASAVRVNELGYALDRMNLFRYETIDSISAFTLTQRIASSALVYVFLLSVFVFAYFCKGSNPAFLIRARLSGISRGRFYFTEVMCITVMMYAVYVLIYIGLSFTKIGINTLSLAAMLPIVFILALIVTSFCYLFRSPVSAAYISFAVFTVLMYLAGGLLPLEFMPKFLQKAAVLNPLKYLADFALEAMFG